MSVSCAGGLRVRTQRSEKRGRPELLRRRLSSVGCPRERRQMPEDRRNVAIGVERDREGEEDQRKAAREDERTRPKRTTEREQGPADQEPSVHVVQERRPREQPAVALVDEEGGTGNDECERNRQAPVLAA